MTEPGLPANSSYSGLYSINCEYEFLIPALIRCERRLYWGCFKGLNANNFVKEYSWSREAISPLASSVLQMIGAKNGFEFVLDVPVLKFKVVING